MPREQNYFECRLAQIDPGYAGNRDEPPSPALCEGCYHPEVTDELFNKYTEMENPEKMLADNCRHFSPILIERCENCGLKMGVARYDWKIWAVGYEDIPCCSELCRGQLQLKSDRELQVVDR